MDLKAKNETLGKEKKDLTAQVVALQNAASAKEDQVLTRSHALSRLPCVCSCFVSIAFCRAQARVFAIR